jgi:predicted nucleotidyltransferase component of viral defense system
MMTFFLNSERFSEDLDFSVLNLKTIKEDYDNLYSYLKNK